MGDEKTAVADAAEKEPKVLEGKDLIYQSIAEFIESKTGKRFGRTNGQALMNLVIEETIALAIKEESLRLNQGFGSFHLKTYPAGERTLPNGEKTVFGERRKLRYEGGVMTDYLIDKNGDAVAARAAFQADRKKEPKPTCEAESADENLD